MSEPILLGLFLKLIDRCIDLVKHRQESNRSLYVDFVAPAMVDFESVHKDYIDGFQRYRDLIQNSPHRMNGEHPIFDTLSRDNLFSEGLRAKVQELYPLRADPVLGRFISSIRNYLLCSFAEDDMSRVSQVVRMNFIAELRSAVASEESDTDKKQSVIHEIDRTVGYIQERYRMVLHECSLLKQKLLQPK